MAVQNGLDDIETQSYAVSINAAGVVGFVEPVKYQRKLLRGDGLAGVHNADLGFAAALPPDVIPNAMMAAALCSR